MIMWEGLALVMSIILIDIVLSGDNALVIGMASKNLPVHQRKTAIWWGAFGAVSLRLILTVLAVYLLDIPYIQAAGAALLMYIAIKLLMDESNHTNIKSYTTLGSAVRTIILADFVMSLDNVLAIAALAHGNILVIVLGIGLSIPLIIWGSQVIMMLLNKYPILVFLGAGVLGYTAGEMLVSDEKVTTLFEGFHHSYHWIIPVAFTIIVMATGFIYQKVKSGKKVVESPEDPAQPDS